MFLVTGHPTFAPIALVTAPALAVYLLTPSGFLAVVAWGVLSIACLGLFMAALPGHWHALERRVFVGLASAIAALVLFPLLAHAQEGAPSSTAVNLGGLFGDLRSTIETVLGVGVAAILGLLAALLKKSLGVSIDGRMRDTLQSALMNGVHAGLDLVQEHADKTTIDVKSTVIANGLQYVRQYAPAAIKHFGLGEADIETMLRAQLAKLQPAETQAVAKVAGA